MTVGPLAIVGGQADPARYVGLAAALALAMGAMLLLAGVFRLGFVADFFGKPVLLGYINGVALIVIAALVDLPGDGIAVVGEVPGGLPSFGLPEVRVRDVLDLALPAAAFALVAFADVIATVRTFAQKHGYDVDPNQELTAIGGANLIGGLSGAFPVSSSNSRSAVNDAAGAQTQAAVVVAAAVVGLFLLFAMPLIALLPTAALGVIIVVAAGGLINLRPIWRLRHVRAAETALALVACGGVLVFGVVGGVAIAIALSIGVFLYRAARPHDAVLGRVADVDGYHDIGRWDGAETTPGLLVYRFDAPPFFVNAEYLRQRVLALADGSQDITCLVLNAEAWTFLDSTAIDVLTRLHVELCERDITLCVARLKARQREIFDDTGLTARIGPDRFYPSVRTVVAAFTSSCAPLGSMARGEACERVLLLCPGSVRGGGPPALGLTGTSTLSWTPSRRRRHSARAGHRRAGGDRGGAQRART